MLLHPLPVKCIEAVFLGLLLTQGWTQLQRLPLGFKSRGSNGCVYRHIVLAVADCSSSGATYAALGISRCSALMDKPLQHSSLAGLVEDYAQAYRCGLTGPSRALTHYSYVYVCAAQAREAFAHQDSSGAASGARPGLDRACLLEVRVRCVLSGFRPGICLRAGRACPQALQRRPAATPVAGFAPSAVSASGRGQRLPRRSTSTRHSVRSCRRASGRLLGVQLAVAAAAPGAVGSSTQQHRGRSRPWWCEEQQCRICGCSSSSTRPQWLLR
jgi:hypothetical protein